MERTYENQPARRRKLRANVARTSLGPCRTAGLRHTPDPLFSSSLHSDFFSNILLLHSPPTLSTTNRTPLHALSPISLPPLPLRLTLNFGVRPFFVFPSLSPPTQLTPPLPVLRTEPLLPLPALQPRGPVSAGSSTKRTWGQRATVVSLGLGLLVVCWAGKIVLEG